MNIFGLTFKLSIVLLLNVVGVETYARSSKIDSAVVKVANDSAYMNKNEGRISVIVVMEPVEPLLTSGWVEPSPAEVQYHLIKRTAEKQWEMRSLVNQWVTNQYGPSVKNYMFLWSTNTLIVEASPEAIWEMAEMPVVNRVLLDERVAMTQPVERVPVTAPDKQDEVFTYGLQRIRIPEVRSQHPDITGEGVIVGILDTGLDPNHPEVAGKMIAWRDFISDKEQAYDDNGHGTHVAGTIAGEGSGGTQIGVAPRVKLVIGKIFSGSGFSSAGAILRGMEWVANPDRKFNSSLRPRVINNSWGGGMRSDIRQDPFAQQVVNWVQLQIFPAFAAGNSGRSGAGSIGSPAGLPMAFAVGATNANDELADFSSRGPVRIIDFEGKNRTYIKPDVSAPGHQVYSSMPNGKYARMSGTSMATPHLAGAVALIYQLRPDLSVEQMTRILMDSSEDLGEAGKDNHFGAGRLDVVKALEAASRI
jgi:subtilisin family serine protease